MRDASRASRRPRENPAVLCRRSLVRARGCVAPQEGAKRAEKPRGSPPTVRARSVFCVLCSVTGGAAYPARVTARVRRLCAPTRPRLSRRLEQPLLTTPPSFLCFLRASHGTSSAGRPRRPVVVVHHSRRSSRTRALNVPASRADGQSCWHCEKRRSRPQSVDLGAVGLACCRKLRMGVRRPRRKTARRRGAVENFLLSRARRAGPGEGWGGGQATAPRREWTGDGRMGSAGALGRGWREVGGRRRRRDAVAEPLCAGPASLPLGEAQQRARHERGGQRDGAAPSLAGGGEEMKVMSVEGWLSASYSHTPVMALSRWRADSLRKNGLEVLTKYGSPESLWLGFELAARRCAGGVCAASAQIGRPGHQIGFVGTLLKGRRWKCRREFRARASGCTSRGHWNKHFQALERRARGGGERGSLPLSLPANNNGERDRTNGRVGRRRDWFTPEEGPMHGLPRTRVEGSWKKARRAFEDVFVRN